MNYKPQKQNHPAINNKTIVRIKPIRNQTVTRNAVLMDDAMFATCILYMYIFASRPVCVRMAHALGWMNGCPKAIHHPKRTSLSHSESGPGEADRTTQKKYIKKKHHTYAPSTFKLERRGMFIGPFKVLATLGSTFFFFHFCRF